MKGFDLEIVLYKLPMIYGITTITTRGQTYLTDIRLLSLNISYVRRLMKPLSVCSPMWALSQILWR